MKVIIGPDVSFYQDDTTTPQGIDFIKMRLVSNFTIIRAGQNQWPDPNFKTNWSKAKTVGLPRGSYWFYDSRVDPKQQAELWVAQFNSDLGELPLFADFEEAYGGPYTGWQYWKDFLERTKTLVGGKEIGIYTAFYYWQDHAPNPINQPTELEYFNRYTLWIANYGVTKPLVPKPWGEDEWVFWQFAVNGDGKSYGAESQDIDLNYFNGDGPAFTQRFNLTTPEVPHEYPPQTSITGKFKVTATVLNIREGPGTNYNVLGTLPIGTIVDGLALNPDGNWTQIRRADGLVGWCFSQYLVHVDTPPPPPPSQGVSYRVTATVLNSREGPGMNYNVTGNLPNGTIVDGLGTNPDGSWTQIRRADGLTGWCFSQYLIRVDNPPPPPEDIFNWYRVTATTLNVREGVGTTFKVLGSLTKDDIIASIGINADASWIQISRVDGLAGWCSAQYLTDLGTSRPNSVVQRIFSGVAYYRKESLQPHKIVAHALTIDLRSAGLKTLVTPPEHPTDHYLCSSKTSQFLQKQGLQIAINGDGFSYLDPGGQNPCPGGGDPVNPNGYAASRGVEYSKKNPTGAPILYINQKNEVTFDQVKGKLYNAVSGDRTLVTKGKAVNNLDSIKMDPRTAVGLSQNGRSFILLVVDGRESSEGATFAELANLLISFGAYSGISLDGGGSSTMAIQGIDGKPRVLNTPIDDNVPGQERAVANHLGVFVKK